MRIVGALLLTIVIAVPAATRHVDAAAQAGTAAETADANAIKNVAETYRKASVDGDVKALMALYAEDAIEFPPNEPMLKGKASIEAFYRRQMEKAKLISLEFTHLDTRASGDIGYDVGAYRQTLKPASGGEVKDSGHYTVIVKKVGGEWKVTSAIYNSDRPVRHEQQKPVQTTGTTPKP